jgi:hypothetical protein
VGGPVSLQAFSYQLSAVSFIGPSALRYDRLHGVRTLRLAHAIERANFRPDKMADS